MFKNYLKVALRNLYRYKVYSIINIVGLAIGLSASFMMLLIIEHETSFDKHNEKIDRIGRVVSDLVKFNAKNSLTPFPLAKSLEENFPEVEKSSSALNIYTRVKYDDKINERIRIYSIDTSLTNILTFNLVYGNKKTIFDDKNWTLLSESKSKKYFGDENPIGKRIEIELQGLEYSLIVTGVYKDLPETSTFQSEILVPINIATDYINKRYKQKGPDAVNRWDVSKFTTYLLLQNPNQFKNLEQKVKKLGEKQTETVFQIQPLDEVYFNSSDIGDPFFAKGDKQKVLIYTIIAFFILGISIANYISLSIAKLVNRTFEIGVRKVLGATKSLLLLQITSESLLLVLVAIPFSIVIFYTVIGEFIDILDIKMSLVYIDRWSTYVGFVILSIVVSLLSGIIVSLKIINLNTAQILQNKIMRNNKKIKLRHGFVLFQMIIFVGLIIGATAVKLQVDYFRNKNLGFDKENVVILNLEKKNRDRYSVFKETLLKEHNIVNVSASRNLPPYQWYTQISIERNNDKETLVPVMNCSIDYDFLKTMKLELIKGRDFSKEFGADNNGFILNETAIKQLQVGPDMTIHQRGSKVIGVVKDFNFQPLHGEVKPLILRLTNGKYLGEILVRFKGEDVFANIETIKAVWEEIYPESVINYHFFDEVIDKLYQKEMNFSTVINVFTILTLSITCLGLFGLILFTTEQRTKEIGIRKVLGASVHNIATLLSKEFIILVIIATIIASPIAYYLIEKWLSNFANRIDISFGIILFASGLALLVALFTISFQIIKAATANPVDSLRNE